MISPVPTTTPGECAARAGTESSTLTGSVEAHTPPVLNKQQRSHRRRQALGLCRLCDDLKVDKNHCKKHAEQLRIAARNRYRLLAGIPLDAPLSNNGRPRIGSTAATTTPLQP